MSASKEAEVAEHALPHYENSEVPAYEHAPAYETHIVATQRPVTLSGLNLTLDPTGTSIRTMPADGSPPLYVLNNSMLKAHGSGSVHIQRAVADGTEKLISLYAISEHFISALNKPVNTEFRSVTAARSHGALVTINLREIVWDFSTRIPLPKGKDVATDSGYSYPTDPVYQIGTSAGPGSTQKHLLQFLEGKVVNSEDEVIALEREGGAECEGMPVLSITKELDQEMMDFLVSAWLVTMWGEVGKRVRRQSKSSSGKGFSIGKFKIGG